MSLHGYSDRAVEMLRDPYVWRRVTGLLDKIGGKELSAQFRETEEALMGEDRRRRIARAVFE